MQRYRKSEKSRPAWRFAKSPKPTGSFSPLSDGLILTFGTVLAYSFSYLYELGYARHFGIPNELISPTTASIVVAFMTSSFAVLSASNIFGLTKFLLRRLNLPKLKWSVDQCIIFAIGMLCIEGPTKDAVTNIYVFSFLILIRQITFLILDDGSIMDRLKKAEMTADPMAQIDLLAPIISRQGATAVYLFNFALIGGYVAFSLGCGAARFQINYQVITDAQETVLLRQYGDLWITSVYSPADQSIGGAIQAFKLSDAKHRVSLETKRIGPLRSTAIEKPSENLKILLETIGRQAEW